MNRAALSDAIHSCVMDVLGLPAEKRAHRFLSLEAADFIRPADRSEHYTIVEISMFEGRSVETKKQLIRALFTRLAERNLVGPQDLEITITETPRHNWGIRGLPGDELVLNYKVEK
ncbi:MAG TPA: tautomerase family protein [Opitutaceae bacterium]|nr:tautomerase family protein [Opitutaceae bacterium]